MAPADGGGVVNEKENTLLRTWFQGAGNKSQEHNVLRTVRPRAAQIESFLTFRKIL
jgi:hypothetical protein